MVNFWKLKNFRLNYDKIKIYLVMGSDFMKKLIYSIICTLLLSKMVYASEPELIINNIPLISDISSQLNILDYDVDDISYICIVGM